MSQTESPETEQSPETAPDQGEAQLEAIAEDSVEVEPQAPVETRTFADFGVREDIAEALAEAGAGTVYLAGRPAALADDLRAAGVTGFLHAGGDLLAFLKDALRRATPA